MGTRNGTLEAARWAQKPALHLFSMGYARICLGGLEKRDFDDPRPFCGEVVDSIGRYTHYQHINPRCFCGDLIDSIGLTSL